MITASLCYRFDSKSIGLANDLISKSKAPYGYSHPLLMVRKAVNPTAALKLQDLKKKVTVKFNGRGSNSVC